MRRKKLTQAESEEIRDMVNSGVSKHETARRLGYSIATINRHTDVTRKPISDCIKNEIIEMYTVKDMTQASIAEAMSMSKTTVHRLLSGFKRPKTKPSIITKPKRKQRKLKARKTLPADKVKPELKQNPDKIKVKPFAGMKRHRVVKGLWVEIDAGASEEEVNKIIDRKRKVYGF